MPEPFTTFKGLNNIGNPTISESIKVNLLTYMDWSFLTKGGYDNVDIPVTGVYGGLQHQLRYVDDQRYDSGQVFEGFRSGWVWESGTGQTPEPIVISGVNVDGTFYPSNTTGAFGHHINYPDGQIVFATGIATTSTVTAEYSYRWVNVLDATDIPWFQEVQYNSHRLDQAHFLQSGSGDWAQYSQTRVQLPAIAIELGRRKYNPFQLGGGQYCRTDVLFHIFAEDTNTAEKLGDIISFQHEKTIWMFDLDLMAMSGGYPLDYQGSLVDGALSYPDLVRSVDDGGFRWNKIRFDETEGRKGNWIHRDLYHSTVKMTTEVVLPNI
jgi:hypothetical protein